MTQTDVPLPQVRGFGRTSRTDRWWVTPFLTFLGLSAFVVYSTWAAFQGDHYHFAGGGAHYLSPFYSPELFGDSPHAWFGPKPSFIPGWLPWSPAFLILWAPAGFRFTCYYYRGAYYKAFFLDPPACAVGEPSIHRRFAMENKFPFILMNAHRFALYLAFIPLVVLWWDLIVSMTHDGHFRLGLGVFLIAADAILVTLYVGSCHSFRHLVGGSMDCFSCTAYTETRHGIWKWVSRINVHHGKYAWLSLFSIILVDLYVRAMALDIINTSTPIIGGFL